jgi:hypothetical protein
MRSILVSKLTIAAFLALSTVALAKPVKVVPGDPPISVDIPSSWEVTEIKRGIQAKTDDEEVFLWFESYVPAQFETLLAEHNTYFKEQGVTITGEPQAQSKEFPTYFLKFSDYPATYEAKPTVLRYVSVVMKDESRKHLLMSYWASPEGDKQYDADMNKIMDSLRGSVEAR